jgi:hypothetical protein
MAVMVSPTTNVMVASVGVLLARVLADEREAASETDRGHAANRERILLRNRDLFNRYATRHKRESTDFRRFLQSPLTDSNRRRPPYHRGCRSGIGQAPAG